MSLFGGIISGAMTGAGQAGTAALNLQQQQDGNLYNAESLAKLNADLEVHKQTSIMQAQNRIRQDNLDNYPQTANAQPVPLASSPAPQATTSTTQPSAAPSGLDLSDRSPADLARFAKLDPVAFSNGVADFQKTSQAPTPQSPAGLGASNAPTSPAPQAAFWQPSRDVMAAAMRAEMINPGAGAEVIKNNAPTEIGRLLIAQGINPSSPAGQAAIAGQVSKLNYIPPASIRGPGWIDPHDGLFHATPTAAVEQFNQATEAGKGSVMPFSGVDANGNPLPVTNRTAAATGQGGGSSDLYAAAPLGQTDVMSKLGVAAGDRINATRASAADSPMRINVLDNLYNLSQQGVQTGPGADWQNSIKGVVANLPGFRDTSVAKAWQGNVSDYQEFSKFAMQNAQRAWTAAGGSGTDAQLEAQIQANINHHLFPQAVQQIAIWNKGGELAIQAKSNAQDQWLQTHGTTPQSQATFENTWRNNMDPQIFVLKATPPAQATATLEAMKANNPSGYNTLLQKLQTLQSMGAQ